MSAAVNNYANTGGATTTPATNLPANGRTTASLVLDDRLGHTREVGNQATWSLSSCKPGMKVKYLGCPPMSAQIFDDNGLIHMKTNI